MDLIKIRHHIHRNPEISGEEDETAQFILKKLKGLSLDKIHNDFYENAILAEIDSGAEGKTVLFRCELDALPIQETNTDLSYKSKKKGVAHKCGHDGHMAMLLGLAQKLVDQRPETGKVLLLFQPAEENGTGAKGVLNSQKLEEFEIDFVFALHNVPGYPLGSIVSKPGSFTPSVESLEVDLLGKPSHAGMPENGINPAVAIAELVQFYQTLHQPDRERDDYFLSTPVHIKMGKSAYGTAAGRGLLGYTFRSENHDFFARQKERIVEETQEIAWKTEGLKNKLNWKEGFEANKNDEKAFQMIKKAASKNSLKFVQKESPFSWGEDFGALTQQYPGAMFGLGSGKNQPELHNPDFDFPDQILDQGIVMFYTLAKSVVH